MTIIEELKELFSTGSTPTEADFAKLIDEIAKKLESPISYNELTDKPVIPANTVSNTELTNSSNKALTDAKAYTDKEILTIDALVSSMSEKIVALEDRVALLETPKVPTE